MALSVSPSESPSPPTVTEYHEYSEPRSGTSESGRGHQTLVRLDKVIIIRVCGRNHHDSDGHDAALGPEGFVCELQLVLVDFARIKARPDGVSARSALPSIISRIAQGYNKCNNPISIIISV